MIREVDTHYGKMVLPDTDAGQYHWFDLMGVSCEDEYIELVCDLLDEQPKGLALDIGANFGAWTLPLSKHCERVVAFEPQMCCYELLQRTLDVNNIHNVEMVACAVGAERGTIMVPQLDIDKDSNFGGVALGIPHHEQLAAPMLPVPLTTIDYCMTLLAPGFNEVTFMKIDVEGGEVNVLKGARETIARCRPLLFVEAVHKYTDLAELTDLLQSMGYFNDIQGPNYLSYPL